MFGLLATTVILVCVVGCKSATAPGSSSLAAVLIRGSSPDRIRQNVIPVFQQDGWTLQRPGESELVFEKEGTKLDNRLYGSWIDGPVWLRAEVRIEPYGDAQLLRCDAFVVHGHDDSFLAENQRIQSFGAGHYKKLLESVQRRVNAQRSG